MFINCGKINTLYFNIYDEYGRSTERIEEEKYEPS